MGAGAPGPKQLGFYLALSQVGMEMVVPVAAGVAADYYLGWGPWGAVLGAILGLVGGITHLVVLLNRGEGTDEQKP